MSQPIEVECVSNCHDGRHQFSHYIGTRDALVSHGIVPKVMFDHLGKSGTKSGAKLGHPGIYLRGKLAGGRYRAQVFHPAGQAPYQAELHRETTDKLHYLVDFVSTPGRHTLRICTG